MSEQMSFEGFANGTCSPALGAGQSPCDSPAGQTIAKSSPRRARASRSAKRVKEADSVTTGTCGPVRTPSSVTCAPKSAWESRLMGLLGMLGSTERELTWKTVATPSERSYFQLAVSTPRRVDIAGFGLPAEPQPAAEHWPIVSARDWKSDSSIKTGEELYGTKGKPLARTALDVAQGEHWPGVRANRRGNPDSHGADPVAMVAGMLPDGLSDQTGTSEPAPSKPGESRKSPGGSLHPAMAAWLQGYSQAHLNCAPSCLPKAGQTARRKSKATETPSCPR